MHTLDKEGKSSFEKLGQLVKIPALFVMNYYLMNK